MKTQDCTFGSSLYTNNSVGIPPFENKHYEHIGVPNLHISIT